MWNQKKGLILTVLTALVAIGVPWGLSVLVEQYHSATLPAGEADQYGSSMWVIRGAGICIAIAATAFIIIWKQKRLDRQIDKLVERCNKISLTDPLIYKPHQMMDLPDLDRLDLAILVMRDVLVDHLVFYRRFFEAAPDMFLTLSPVERRIQDANQAFFQKLDLLPSEVIGQKIERFVALNQGWDLAMGMQGNPLRGLLLTGRGPLKVEVNFSWEKRSQDEPWILGARISDISQREKLINELVSKSAALENALEEARSVEKLKDEFLTTLSHEIKTPMVSLKGFLQLIKEGRIQPDKEEEYLAICWRNLLKLEVQINNLLDLARLSAKGQENFPLEEVDLGVLLRTELENIKMMAAEKSLTIAEPPDGRFMIKGNAEKLIQLIDNLLVNAVKYNKEAGRIDTGLEKKDGKVVLTVKDSGVGIEREQMAKIFNRFYRAEITGTGRIEGLGIGLSLVQEIVLLHGGNIEVSSRPGRGTTFTVILESI